jgi:peptidoglycan/LPS O-acetylase OafA/YrhL
MPITSVGPQPSVDELVDATPIARERVVDFVRVVCIGVVVLWHWVLSITQWNRSGQLVMPNLIDHVDGLWLATWVLQIMPAFFIVGGYANLASWQGGTKSDTGAMGFWRRRLRRLLRPAVVLMVCWTAVDAVLVASGGRRSDVLHWGMVTFVPLWFLGVYVAVVLLVPLTATLHRRWGVFVPVVLVVAMVASGPGLATTALVWVFAHQLGYFWRDGSLGGKGRSHERLVGTALMATAAIGLTLLTTAGGYPRSMVATGGETGSNMFPTSICIAALACLQLGLLLLARPALERWLQRRSVWKAVVSANGIAMTVFCWHMTALIAVIAVVSASGGHLLRDPTAAWWMWRPLWLLGPAAVLTGLVALFARFERS